MTRDVSWRTLSFIPLLFDSRMFIALLTVLILATNLDMSAVGSLVGVLAILPISIAHYYSVRWQLLNDRVIIKRGLIAKKEIVIPFIEIHDIDYVQNPIHKLVGAATLQFQTSGGGESTSKSLESVRLRDIELVRNSYKEYRSSMSDELTDDEEGEQSLEGEQTESLESASLVDTIAVLSNLDNLKLALARAPIRWLMSIFALVLTALYTTLAKHALAFFEPYLHSLLPEIHFLVSFPWIRLIIPDLCVFFTGFGIVFALALAFFVISFAFAAMASYALLHDFRLTHRDGTLHTTAGAWVKVDRKTPLRRVQMLKSVKNLRLRCLGCRSIFYDSSATEATDSNSIFESTFGKWLIPLIADENLNAVYAKILPMINYNIDHWNSVERRAWKRRFKKNVISIVPILIVLSLFSWWLLLFSLPLLVIAWICSIKYVTSISYTLDDEGILVRKGWWIQSVIVIPYEKIQGIGTKPTFFDRMNGMATLQIDVAGHSSIGLACEIPYLSEIRAKELFETLSPEAQSRHWAW